MEKLAAELETGRRASFIDFTSVSSVGEIYTSAREALASLKGNTAIIGWSMGSQVALSLAAENKSVSQVILLSPTVKFCRAEGYQCGVPPEELRALISSVRRDPQKAMQYFSKLVSSKESSCFDYLCGVEAGANKENSLLTGLEYLERTDLRKVASQIETPTFIVHGSEDKVIPVDCGKWLASTLVSCLYLEVDGGGHDLPWKMPDDVLESLRGFLD